MTRTEICNMALALVGAQQITDYSESSQEARICRVFYANMYDSVLRGHPWNCALYRAALAELTDATPSFGWDHAYALPSDPWCLRVLEMQEKTYGFVVEGRQLLTDESTAKIRYIGRVANLGDLDPWVVQVMCYSLASRIAFSLMQSNSLKEMLVNELNQIVMPEAKSKDAFESNEPEEEHSSWLDSRQ